MRSALALVLLLSGCGPLAPVAVGQPCATGEVACGSRQDYPHDRLETRCFYVCLGDAAGGQWAAMECLPECGPGRAVETGVNGTACELPPVACVPVAG